MRRFYFNVRDGVTTIDEDGIALPDEQAARQQAIRYARTMVAEDAFKGRICLNYRIEVEDEDRRPVLTLPFSAAVEVVS